MAHAARLVERHRDKEAFSFLHRIRPSALPRSARAEWWDLAGRLHQNGGDFHRAYDAYRRSLDLQRKSGDRWGLVESARRLGEVSRQREMFHESLRWYALAERTATRLKSPGSRLDARCGQAMALRGLGRYDAAIAIFRSLLPLYERRRDGEGVAYVLWAMGTTERFAGRLKDAELHLRKAIARYKRVRDVRGLAYAQCGLGGTLRMRGLAKESRRLYARAHVVFRREGDEFGQAYSACGQANGLRMTGRLRDALPFMKRAERGYRRLRLWGPLGFVLWSRAQLLVEKGDFLSAEAQLRNSERAFRKARDPRGAVYVKLGFAELARAQNQDAALLYEHAGARAKKLGLRLEYAHAKVRSGARKISFYRQIGVSRTHFARYRSLP